MAITCRHLPSLATSTLPSPALCLPAARTQVLPRHSAFHTPLMTPMAAELHRTPRFAPPALPLVDGTGRLWPYPTLPYR